MIVESVTESAGITVGDADVVKPVTKLTVVESSMVNHLAVTFANPGIEEDMVTFAIPLTVIDEGDDKVPRSVVKVIVSPSMGLPFSSRSSAIIVDVVVESAGMVVG